jgi:hypothetical protein
MSKKDADYKGVSLKREVEQIEKLVEEKKYSSLLTCVGELVACRRS